MATSNKKPEAASKKKQYKDDDWRKIVAVVILIALVVIIGIVSVVWSTLSAPKQVSDRFLAAVQTSNGAAAYADFSSEAKAAVPADKFSTAVKQIGPILNGQAKNISRSINKESGQPATAKVEYELKGSDGLTYKITILLTKEGDNWKVTDFNSAKK